MPKRFMHYRILLSCPSDMDSEREIIQQAVKKANEEDASFKNVYFDIQYWSKDVLFSHGTPQQRINEEIVYPSDLIVALFGSKLGTPTEKYASGTIEEIEKMIEMNKQVFVCFSEKDILLHGDVNEDVLQEMIKVQKFKKNYNGLYITYKSDSELISKIERQLRLYLSKIVVEKDDKIVCDVPFTYQELQGIISNISEAKEVIFCARTGKIFLTGHYNQLKELVEKGGDFKYITSENFNITGDSSEFNLNQNYAYQVIKNLYKLAPDRVQCLRLQTPVNNTLLYIKRDNEEKINVKFNFQSEMKSRRPMFWLDNKSPIFNIFYNELEALLRTADLVKL